MRSIKLSKLFRMDTRFPQAKEAAKNEDTSTSSGLRNDAGWTGGLGG